MVSHPGMRSEKNAGKEGSRRRVPALAFYGYLNRYRTVFVPSLIALFVTAGLSLAFPYYLSKLIGSPTGSPLEMLNSTASPDVSVIRSNINQTVITLLAILALQAFIAYWRVRGFIKAGESALNDIRVDVFSRLVRLPLEFFQGHRAGELSNRVSADLAVLSCLLYTSDAADE